MKKGKNRDKDKKDLKILKRLIERQIIMEEGVEAEKQINAGGGENITKRFVLPREERLKARLDSLKESLDSLQVSHPEIVGMTLYGSMVTGSATESSDIDGFVFLEESKAGDYLTDEDWQWAEEERHDYERKKPEWSTSVGVSEIDLAATHRYSPIVQEALKGKGLTDEQIKHIRVRVISDEIIGNELTKTLESENEFIKYQGDIVMWNKKMDELPIDQWPSWDEKPEYPNRYTIDWKIPALFHLEVGKELNHYRNEVVRRLKKAGDSGERVWKQIIGHTADMERHMRGSNYPHLYPTTIDEATNFYHLEANTK